MDRRALQDALEARRRLGVLDMRRDQVRQLVVNIVRHVSAQLFELDRAGAQHRHGVLILGQGEEQMLQRRVFMAPLVGVSECPMKCFLKIA